LPRKNSENAAGPYRKPRADVYTVLLVIALVALLLAIYALFLEMDDFHFAIKGGPPVTWVSPPAATIAAVAAVRPLWIEEPTHCGFFGCHPDLRDVSLRSA
jgi:hypothetical protein